MPVRWIDRPTGRVIRRIETSRPGELVHVDTKKLSRIPRGGGWRAHGWETRSKDRQKVGYDNVHSMIDAYSRLAYSEILPIEDARDFTNIGPRVHGTVLARHLCGVDSVGTKAERPQKTS